MMFYSHLAVAEAATGLLTWAGAFPHSPAVPIAAAVGAALPDIDNPNSTMGRKAGLLSEGLNATVGHRGITHSVWGMLAATGICFTLVALLTENPMRLEIVFAFLLGYATHLAADLFCDGGIPLFHISRHKRTAFPKSYKHRIKTGSGVEKLIGLCAAAVAGVTFYAAWRELRLSFLRWPALPHLHLPSVHLGPFIFEPYFYITEALALLAVVCLVWLVRWRARLIMRDKTQTFLIEMPRASEDLPLRAEQLFNILHNIRLPRARRILAPQPHLDFMYVMDKDKAMYFRAPDVFGIPGRVKTAIEDKFTDCRVELSDFRIPAHSDTPRFYGRCKFKRPAAWAIRTLKGFYNDDPLQAFLGRMDHEEIEFAVYQFLIKPIGTSWGRSGRRMREKVLQQDNPDVDKISSGKGRGLLHLPMGLASGLVNGVMHTMVLNKDTVDGVIVRDALEHLSPSGVTHVSEDTSAMVTSLAEKLNSKSPWRCELRVLVQGKSARRHHINQVVDGLKQYSLYNEFTHNKVYAPWDRLTGWMMRNDIYPFFGSKTILIPEELASLIHPIYQGTGVSKLRKNLSRYAPLPKELSVFEPDRIILGQNLHRGQPEMVTLPLEDLPNFFMCGKTRTGKTEELKKIFLTWIARGYGALFLDPQGDAASELLDLIPDGVADRTYFLDPDDMDFPFAYNPLDFDKSDLRVCNRVRTDIEGLFASIWKVGTETPNILKYIGHSLKLLCHSEGTHLGCIEQVINNPEYRQALLDQYDDRASHRFWDHFASLHDKERESQTNSTLSRVLHFSLDDRMQRILCQSDNKLDIMTMMEEGAVIIAHIGDNNIGKLNQKLLASLLITSFHQAAYTRSKLRQDKERKPYLLVLDEAQNFITPTLMSIAAEDSKYGLHLGLAFQVTKQIEDVLSIVGGNTNSRFAFRIDQEDSAYLAPYFTRSSNPDELRATADDLINLGRFTAYMKSTVRGEPVPATTVTTMPPLRPTYNNRQKIIDNTHRTVCREADDVVSEIARFDESVAKVRGRHRKERYHGWAA